MSTRFYHTLLLQAPPLAILPYWQGEVVAEGILNFLYDNYYNLSLLEHPSDWLEESHYWEDLHNVYYQIQGHYQELLPFNEYLESTRRAIQTVVDANQVGLTELNLIPPFEWLHVIRIYESSLVIVATGVR